MYSCGYRQYILHFSSGYLLSPGDFLHKIWNFLRTKTPLGFTICTYWPPHINSTEIKALCPCRVMINDQFFKTKMLLEATMCWNNFCWCIFLFTCFFNILLELPKLWKCSSTKIRMLLQKVVHPISMCEGYKWVSEKLRYWMLFFVWLLARFGFK